jgi:hypothetical protein
MRFSTSIAGAVLSAAVAPSMAREMPVDELKAAKLYDSGLIHQQLIAKKIAHWEAEQAAGLMNATSWPRLNPTKCVNGVAEAIKGDPLHTFRCKNVSLPAPSVCAAPN